MIQRVRKRVRVRKKRDGIERKEIIVRRGERVGRYKMLCVCAYEYVCACARAFLPFTTAWGNVENYSGR